MSLQPAKRCPVAYPREFRANRAADIVGSVPKLSALISLTASSSQKQATCQKKKRNFRYLSINKFIFINFLTQFLHIALFGGIEGKSGDYYPLGFSFHDCLDDFRISLRDSWYRNTPSVFGRSSPLRPEATVPSGLRATWEPAEAGDVDSIDKTQRSLSDSWPLPFQGLEVGPDQFSPQKGHCQICHFEVRSLLGKPDGRTQQCPLRQARDSRWQSLASQYVLLGRNRRKFQ
jgi:hypothetical protein